MKHNNGFNLINVIFIIIVTAIVSSLATGVIMLNNNPAKYYKSEEKNDAELQEFIKVYNTLLDKYYDNVDKKGMLNAAMMSKGPRGEGPGPSPACHSWPQQSGR